MFRPAPRKVLRAVAGVLLRIVFGVAAFAVLIVAGSYLALGLVLLIRVIP